MRPFNFRLCVCVCAIASDLRRVAFSVGGKCGPGTYCPAGSSAREYTVGNITRGHLFSADAVVTPRSRNHQLHTSFADELLQSVSSRTKSPSLIPMQQSTVRLELSLQQGVDFCHANNVSRASGLRFRGKSTHQFARLVPRAPRHQDLVHTAVMPAFLSLTRVR